MSHMKPPSGHRSAEEWAEETGVAAGLIRRIQADARRADVRVITEFVRLGYSKTPATDAASHIAGQIAALEDRCAPVRATADETPEFPVLTQKKFP